MRVGGGQRGETLLGAELQVLSKLLDPRRTLLARGQPSGRGIHPERQLLGASGDVDGPACVAEVALELAEDRWDGKRGKGRPMVWIEAVDRAHQAHAGDLHQILVG